MPSKADLGHIDLKNSFWTQIIFRCIEFRNRVQAMGKTMVSDALKEEMGLMFYYDIVSKVKMFKIQPTLVINFDQAPSKSVPNSGGDW